MADETAAENMTKIGLRADMTIDEEPVAVEGVLGGDFFLQLSRPATLGTPISFAYWLQDKYGVQNLDLMLPTETYATPADFKAAYKAYKAETDDTKRKAFEKTISDHVKDNVPPQLANLVTTAFLAELTITDLLIDIKAEDADAGVKGSRKMMFGLSVGFPKALDLLPNIEVNKLSILVMNAPKTDFTFPPRIALPISKPLPVEPRQAKGTIVFTKQPDANSTLTLGEDVWKFATGTAKQKKLTIGSTLDGTLAELANRLNSATTGTTALCSYRANLDDRTLEITYKTPGFAGNGFAIAVDAGTNATASGLTLSGGFADGERRQASGSLVFNKQPDDTGKVTLNGVDWGFSATDPADGEKKSKIGADAAETVTNLAKALANSDDKEISKCAYTANGATLSITFLTAGEAGNAFTIAADTKSNATASGKTLAGA